jgi:hypothetical protein
MDNRLTETNGIRRFSDVKIQAAIDEALKHVTPEKPVAVVGHVTDEGWKLSAAARLGDDWSIMAAAYQDWGGSVSADAAVVWTP